MEEQTPALKEVEEEASDLYGKSPAEITAIRGRLIRKIKQEINKIKKKEDASEEEKRAVEELERRLNDLLTDHKEQLSERYDKEFIKQKADLKSLITILPKAVGLSAKMVGNCIEELKEAKTNKARIFKSLELLKSIGLFAATPVIYTIKFIANHWYLIFLLLLLLKLPNFNWNGKGREKPDQIEQPEYEPEPVTVEEPETVIVGEPEREPGMVPNPNPAPQPHPRPVPGLVPKPNPNPAPGMVPVTDTGTGTPQVEPKPEPVMPIEETPGVEIVPELEGEALDYAHSVYNDFFKYLNSQRYHFIIAEQNPDIVIVHTAQEFLEYLKGINPSINATEADALRLYESSITASPSPSEMGVYWVNSGSNLDTYHYFETTKDFADYIINNQEPELTDFFQRFTNQNIDASAIPFSLNGVIESFAESLGISIPAATVLFLLYEGAQYGLAGPTGGLSLGLPF